MRFTGHDQRFKQRVGSGMLAVVLVGATMAACGTAEQSDGGSLRGAALDACLSKAKELRDTKREEPPLKVLGPFDMSANRGKSLWVINAARVPLLQRISDGAEAAAAKAGMKVKTIFGDGTTSSAQAAVRQATAQGADGIALIAVDPRTIQATIDDAVRAGIVVTDIGNRSEGDPLGPGISGQMGYNVPREMDAMAGWIMADSKCSANALMYSPTSLPITVAASKALKARFSALCPTCSFELKDLDYGNFAKTLTAEVQTDVRRKPQLTYIIAIIGSSVPNVDAGLRNSKVRVLTHDGLDGTLKALRDGDTKVGADFAFAPNESIGWQVVDQLGRLIQKQPGATEAVIPTRLVDRSNIGSTEADVWPSFAHYQSAYEQAWR